MSVDKAPFPYAAALIGGAILIGALAFLLIDPSILKPRPIQTPVTPTPVPAPPEHVESTVPKKKEFPPHYNFALASNGASAEGGRDAQRLIDGNATRYSAGSGFATARLDSTPPQSFVVRLAEPVFLRCIRFLLWNVTQDRFYRYKLEVCADDAGSNWMTVADKSAATEQCRGWQDVQFDPRVVKLIRLTGTHNSDNSFFHVVELEAYDDPPPVPQAPPAADPKKPSPDMEF